jgi:hypothetical protein
VISCYLTGTPQLPAMVDRGALRHDDRLAIEDAEAGNVGVSAFPLRASAKKANASQVRVLSSQRSTTEDRPPVGGAGYEWTGIRARDARHGKIDGICPVTLESR